MTTLDKDRSSLTALNVTGLVDLDTLFTLLMSAAAIAIFVFGLMLQRRREYVTLRALGAQTTQVRTMVVGEAGVVVVAGLVAGIVVGTGMAFLLVRILRPIFVLEPGTTFATGEVAGLAALVLVAGVVSALAADVDPAPPRSDVAAARDLRATRAATRIQLSRSGWGSGSFKRPGRRGRHRCRRRDGRAVRRRDAR